MYHHNGLFVHCRITHYLLRDAADKYIFSSEFVFNFTGRLYVSKLSVITTSNFVFKSLVLFFVHKIIMERRIVFSARLDKKPNSEPNHIGNNTFKKFKYTFLKFGYYNFQYTRILLLLWEL